jgi:hypothetical protein
MGIYLTRYDDGDFVIEHFDPELRLNEATFVTTKFDKALSTMIERAIRLLCPTEEDVHVHVEHLVKENSELGGTTVVIEERLTDAVLPAGKYILKDGADFLRLERGATAIIEGKVTSLTLDPYSEAHVAGSIQIAKMDTGSILSTNWDIVVLLRDPATIVSANRIHQEVITE